MAPNPLTRVLFVDDEPAILNAIKRLFRRDAYEIETAPDGAAGLEVFRRFRPAVVVSDNRMPGMTGVEFLSKARAIDPQSVRLMLTGCTDLPAAEAAINQGEVWRFITKPWNDEDLRGTVAGAVERYRLVFENRILLDKLASIGLLAGGVAHELNNPIGGILAYAELMQKELADQPAVASDLKRIEQAAQRAKRIVSDLLDFARTSGKSARSRISIAEVAAKAMGLARFQIQNDAELRTDFGTSDDNVWVDANRIEQVLLNLLSNAIHAVQSCGDREGIVTLRTIRAEEKILVEISDNGPGIAAENIGKIFDPFFTTKRPGEGTGLGLSVSQEIARDHGGVLSVESQVGNGACFRLTLPAMHAVDDSIHPQGDVQ